MSYWFYILYSDSGDKYYYGSSQNPNRRLDYHNNEEKGFTQRYRPWRMVYNYRFDTRPRAEAAERLVKKWKSKKMTRKDLHRMNSLHPMNPTTQILAIHSEPLLPISKVKQ